MKSKKQILENQPLPPMTNWQYLLMKKRQQKEENRKNEIAYKSKIANLEKHEFCEKLIKNKHESVIEHINISIYIKEASRSFMAQITRYRHVSFSIKSQHYCNHSNFKYKMLESEIMHNEYIKLMANISNFYNDAVKNGMPKYIAREVLPNSALTNIFMTANLREWRHIIKERITENNTPEIKEFAEKILLLFNSIMPEIFADLVDLYVKF